MTPRVFAEYMHGISRRNGGVSPRAAEFLREISRRKKWSLWTYSKSRGVFSAKVRVWEFLFAKWTQKELFSWADMYINLTKTLDWQHSVEPTGHVTMNLIGWFPGKIHTRRFPGTALNVRFPALRSDPKFCDIWVFTVFEDPIYGTLGVNGLNWPRDLRFSHVTRKPVYATCDQQRCRSACASAKSDQSLCCSLPDIILHLVSIPEISSLFLAFMTAQTGLSLSWSQTPKTGILVTWLN